MNNDLIAMTFSNQQAALDIKKALERMRTSQTLGAIDVVPVTRDRKGNTIVHLQWQPSSRTPAPGDQIPALIANTIFGESSDEDTQRLTDAGLDELFVKKLKADLVPGSSLILGYFSRESLVDTQHFLDAISQFRGTVLHTTIRDEVEKGVIMNLGHG